MSNIYFISDIHLDINNSEVTKRFLDFIDKKKSDMKELYILGDLFEFWIDDKYDIEQNNIIIDTLHDITKKGTKVFLIHGNRDFLIGKKFTKITNIEILPENYILYLDDKKVLVTHGDLLCTDDIDYQKFRKFIRNKITLKIFNLLNNKIKTKIASFLRGKSKKLTSQKPDDIMDLCSVIHRKAGLDLDQSYQRFVATSRLGKIKEFVDEESPDKISQFSNNLILCSESLDEGGSRSFTLAPQEHQADNSRNAGKVGILNLPSVFGDLHIIDGQHRLFGYNKAQNKDKHYVNVLIFNHQMSLLQQMNVFKDINENQKKLNSNLKWELYEHTLDNNDIKQQISAFFNKNLIDSNFSLYKRVQVGTSIQKEGKGPLALSLLNICQEMTRYKRENTTSVLFDYLYSLFDEGEKDIKTMKLLNGFCNALKENSPQDWDMNSHGLILSGNFFRGLLRVLREILWTWEQDATLSSKLSDINNIDNHFKSFLLPFNEYVNQFDLFGDYEESKKNKSDVKTGNNFLGGGGPKKIASFIAGIIRSSSPAMENFGNDSIYRENIDRETWYQYASNVLNDVGETNDIEAKDSIFVNKVPLGPNRRLIDVDLSDDIHKRKVKEIAIKRLRTLAAFYNYCGGIYIIGVKDGSWREDGCQNEIETYGGYDSWKDKVMDLIRQASAENSTDLSSRCKFFKQELDNGKIIAGISVKRKSDSLNFIKWDTGITGNEYYYRQDGRTPEAIINPTESDFSRLHSWRNDEMESIEEYFTLNQYRTYSEENGRTFEAMYSDQFRVNF